MPEKTNLPVSTQEKQKMTPTMELELFAIRFFHSISPIAARLQAQEGALDSLEKHIAELKRLVGFFLFEHREQVNRLAALCKAEKYISALRAEGIFDFIDISMNLSFEAEIEFVGDTQSPEGKLAFQILAGVDIMLSLHSRPLKNEFMPSRLPVAEFGSSSSTGKKEQKVDPRPQPSSIFCN